MRVQTTYDSPSALAGWQAVRHDIPDEIIIVDDDRDDRDIVKRFFNRLGGRQRLRFFQNGQELLDYIEQWDEDAAFGHLPRLIILDLVMPVRNGADTLAALKSHVGGWSDVPVVMLTGSDDDRLIQEVCDMGANAFLTKPFHPVELANAIRRGFNFTPKYLL